MKKHYNELDSLRGLASMSVLIGHFLLIYPFAESVTYGQAKYGVWNTFKYSPLHVFWAGQEAVIFFFLLSGFVLSLAFYKDNFQLNATWYKRYIIRRFFRIYIPYIVAVVFGILLMFLLKPTSIPDASDFANRIWTSDITFLDIINHIILLNTFDAQNINPVIWSLVHEMRISIIFPLLMLIVVKLNINSSAILITLISIISYILMHLFSTENTSIFHTMHYSSVFLVGALLAKNVEYLVNKVKRLNKFTFILLGIVAILTYTYSWLFYNVSIIHISIINEWATVFGASLIIILALSTKSFSKLLLLRPIHYLGKISYSLYLYHILALFSVIYIIDNYSAKALIFFISFLSSAILAMISYHFVEMLSIRLGNKITSQDKKYSKEKTKAV